MSFTRKVYYNNKPLVLTNSSSQYITENPVAAGYLSLTGAFSRNYRQAFEFLDKPRTLGAIIEDVSSKSLIDELGKLYQPVDAAGGVVTNDIGDLLMIYRRGRWDLPKGKRDEGETMDACALREVEEETGLKKLKLQDKICDTWHIYAQNGDRMLKQTSWYHMTGDRYEKPQPQAEENIEEVRWVSKEDLQPLLFKSYKAIREVLEAAGVKW